MQKPPTSSPHPCRSSPSHCAKLKVKGEGVGGGENEAGPIPTPPPLSVPRGGKRKKGAPAQVKGQGALDKNKQRVRRGAGGLLEMRGVSAHPSAREGGGGSFLLNGFFLELVKGFLG